jgi:hypothetical protein
MNYQFHVLKYNENGNGANNPTYHNGTNKPFAPKHMLYSHIFHAKKTYAVEKKSYELIILNSPHLLPRNTYLRKDCAYGKNRIHSKITWLARLSREQRAMDCAVYSSYGDQIVGATLWLKKKQGD